LQNSPSAEISRPENKETTKGKRLTWLADWLNFNSCIKPLWQKVQFNMMKLLSKRLKAEPQLLFFLRDNPEKQRCSSPHVTWRGARPMQLLSAVSLKQF